MNHPANVFVSSVTGHIFERDFPPSMRNWGTTDPLQLFDANTVKNFSNPRQKLKEHLQKLAKGADALVLWLDNDREGENICFEILDCVFKTMPNKPFKYRYIQTLIYLYTIIN